MRAISDLRRLTMPPQAALLSLLAACGGPPALDAVRPSSTSGLTPTVLALVEQKARAVESAPDDARAHATLGQVYEANEMYEVAALCYENASVIDPDEPRWRFRHAAMLRETGDFDGGLALMERVAGDMPDVAAVHQRLGYYLLDAGRHDEALAEFERVAALAPESPAGHLGIGEILVADGRFEEAVPYLRKALRIDPEARPAHYALGIAFRGLGRIQDAERELGLGVNAHRVYLPDESTVAIVGFARGYKGILQRADSLLASGDAGRAARDLEELLTSYPDDSVVLNNLAAAYISMEDYAKALEFLQRALVADGPQIGALINLSKAHLKLGDPTAALQAANRAISVAPDVGRGYFAKGEALFALNDLVGAHAALDLAIQTDATIFNAHLLFAETSSRLGLDDDALAGFQAMADLRPDFLPAHVNLASTLMRMNRLEEADAALKRAERIAPRHERVTAMRRQLEQLR